MDASHPLSVVTPTLDGDVLRVLAQANATFTTGQLHRILAQHSEDGLRRVLRRLDGQGIVNSERVGNAYAYRFNRDHVAADPIIRLASLQETLLQRIEDDLRHWPQPPVYGAVFGSFARRTAQIGSDVDLLLVRADDELENEWDEHLADLAAKIGQWSGNDGRPITFTVGELERRRTEPLIRDVLSHGLTVCGTRAWFVHLVGRR